MSIDETQDTQHGYSTHHDECEECLEMCKKAWRPKEKEYKLQCWKCGKLIRKFNVPYYSDDEYMEVAFCRECFSQAEARGRESVVEMIEGMKVKVNEVVDMDITADYFDRGYNTALSDLLTKIKEERGRATT